MVTGIGTVNQPQSAGVITSTSTIGNQSVIQGTPAGSVESSMPPRRTNDNRRSNKPIMEKRRRARINNCLNELKTLILDAMKKDPARHSKLEKADILEMTVKHLENLQRQQVAMTAAADPSVINKFRAGFSECASEVGRFPGLEPTVKRRLLQHLANCLQVGVGTIQTTNNNNNNTTNHNNNIIINKQQQSMESTTPILATQAVTNQQQPTTIAPSVITTAQTTTTQSVQLHILPTQNDQFIHHNGIFFTNGNGTGVQLLPTRLPNGDIALVLPTSIQTTTAAPTMQQQQQHHQQSVPQKQPQPTQQQIIYQRTTLSPSQQSQNSHSNSTSPLPMLIPIPTRTASASSVASSSSGVSSMPQQTNSIPSPQSSSSSSPNHYMSPNSPQHYQQHRYEPMDTTPSSPHHHQNGVIHRYSPPMSKPLSLVIRKTSQPEEEKPWRPW